MEEFTEADLLIGGKAGSLLDTGQHYSDALLYT